MSRFDFFLLMFPPTQLTDIVRLTNDELVRRRKPNPTKARFESGMRCKRRDAPVETGQGR